MTEIEIAEMLARMYKVEMSLSYMPDVAVLHDKLLDMFNWAKENISINVGEVVTVFFYPDIDWCSTINLGQVSYYFKHKEDAMLFKLTWCGNV